MGRITKVSRPVDLTQSHAGPRAAEAGFGIAEFLISTLIIMVLSAGVFSLLTDMQSNAGYQTEVQNVLANTRIAMEKIQKHVLQAGNTTAGAAIVPLARVSDTEVQLQSDLTGSAGPGVGDPDGDITDPDENITIRYNAAARSIEIVQGDGTVETVANYISAFSMQYLDATGAIATRDDAVRIIRVTITGTSSQSNPKTGHGFGITQTSDFRLQALM